MVVQDGGIVMLLRIFCAALSALLLGSVLPADAGSLKDAPRSGHGDQWYFEAKLGAPVEADPELDVRNSFGPAGDAIVDYDFNSGYYGSIAVGRYLTEKLRVEMELAGGSVSDPTLDFKVADPTNLFQRKVPTTGKIDAVAGTAYLIHDFPNLGTRVVPFAGIGARVIKFDVENLRPVGSFFIVNDQDTVFALAWVGGFDIPVNERVSFSARYTGTYNQGVSLTDVRGGGVLNADSSDFFIHFVSAGIKVNLGSK